MNIHEQYSDKKNPFRYYALGTFTNGEDALAEQEDYDFQEWALQQESELQ